jgi:hypothetical protein
MLIKSFIFEESGAVTVDWVVLTAGIVGLSIATAAVVSGGVENLSGDVDTRLTDMEAGQGFLDGLGGAINWADYSPISPQHGAAWGNNGLDAEGRTWAENTYDGWSQMSDADLLNTYNTNYAYATSNPTGNMETQTRADYVAISEQIMTERGIDVPNGNMSAAELRDTF